MNEVWKTLKYHDEIYCNYEVSTYGNIRSKNTMKNRALNMDRQGYMCVTIYLYYENGKKKYKNIKLHIAVASTFIENPENKLTVNHKDGNRANNHIDNLEWATYKEQVLHCLDILGHRQEFSNNMKKQFSKAVIQRTMDNQLVRRWNSTREVERELGFLNVCISACARGEQKQAYGYKWAYA